MATVHRASHGGDTVGIRVFPSKNSKSILVDRSLIHYQGFAPIYGDRLKAGELPVPDFQGNRPADFFSKQSAQNESEIHGQVFSHTTASPPSVIHYQRGASTFSGASETSTESPRNKQGQLREEVDPPVDYRASTESQEFAIRDAPPPKDAKSLHEIVKEPQVESKFGRFTEFKTVEERQHTETVAHTETKNEQTKVDVITHSHEQVGIKYRTFGIEGEIRPGNPQKAHLHHQHVQHNHEAVHREENHHDNDAATEEGPNTPPNTPPSSGEERAGSTLSNGTSTSSNHNDQAQTMVSNEFAFLQETKRNRSASDLWEVAEKLEIIHVTVNTKESPDPVSFRSHDSRMDGGRQDSSDIPPAPPLDEAKLRESGSSSTSLTNDSSRQSSTQNSPSVKAAPRKKKDASGINQNLLSELKQLDTGNAFQSLASLKEEEKKLVQEKEQQALEEIQKIRKEFTQEKFYPQIPKYSEKTGKEIPDWQRAMMAKKRAEQAVLEEERKILSDLDNWKNSRSPNWKRNSSSSSLPNKSS